MPPVPYMRQQATRQLRLDLLTREALIQSDYGYSYADAVEDRLRESAIVATELLAETLRMPIVPERQAIQYSVAFEHYVMMLPGRTLGLSGFAEIEESGGVRLYDVAGRYAVMGDEFVGYRSRKGRFIATGLWGIVDPAHSFGDAAVTTEPMPAGATEPAWDVSQSRGGELYLWEPNEGSSQLIALRDDRKIDPWLCPQSEIPEGSTLLCLGRISPAVERMVALEAYFRAWQAITPVPEASQLAGETSGKHSYQKNTGTPKAFGVDLAEELHALRVRVRRMYGTQLLRTGQI